MGLNIGGVSTLASPSGTTLSVGDTVPVTLDVYTKLLMHLDGANNSTVFSDAAGHGNATVGGNAKLSTTRNKFGGSSALFNGVSGASDYISYADHPDWTLGSNDFTIDFWVYVTSYYPTDASNIVTHVASGPDWNNRWDVRITGSGANPAGRLGFQYVSGGTTVVDLITSPVSRNAWVHCAIIRRTNTFTAYINGSSAGSTTYAGSIADISGPLYIGAAEPLNRSLIGSLDELRISIGVARWTANFTPPTAAYAATEVTNWMQVNANGVLTRTRTPYMRGQLTGKGGSYNAGGGPLLVTADENVGNCWNDATGYFTCPVAGHYMAAMGNIANIQAGYVKMRKNGTEIHFTHWNFNSGAWHYVSLSCVVSCAASDTLHWTIEGLTPGSNGFYAAGQHCMYSIALMA